MIAGRSDGRLKNKRTKKQNKYNLEPAEQTPGGFSDGFFLLHENFRWAGGSDRAGAGAARFMQPRFMIFPKHVNRQTGLFFKKRLSAQGKKQ